MTRLPVFLLLLFALSLRAQSCPKEDTAEASVPEVLRGRLIFHDGIRPYFELKLDSPKCGQASIQLIRVNGAPTPVEELRGCRVESQGRLERRLTGYITLDIWQDVATISPLEKCQRQKPFPRVATTEPEKTVQRYTVEMALSYGTETPERFRVTSGRRELKPWQAYASYILTGESVLYGQCAKGFTISKVWGTPEANPSHLFEVGDSSDMAMYDPESAANQGKRDLFLDYSCKRVTKARENK